MYNFGSLRTLLLFVSILGTCLMNASQITQAVRVWDLPTRVFHILLIFSVLGLVTTGELGGDFMRWHFWFGYHVLALILFRLVWGVLGGHWSRFVNFVPTPRGLIDYIQTWKTMQPNHHVSHNPLGAMSVVVMLLLLLGQVITGLLSDDEIATSGPWVAWAPNAWVSVATTYHGEIGKVLLICLVVVHVATVVYYKRIRNNDLISPMLHGDKQLPLDTPSSRDTLTSRLFALSIFMASAYVVYRLVNLG
jgi:cytochrome b